MWMCNLIECSDNFSKTSASLWYYYRDHPNGNITQSEPAWKVSVFGVILVRILPHLDWIRRDTPISLYSVQMWENVNQNNSEYGHYLWSVSHSNPRLK